MKLKPLDLLTLLLVGAALWLAFGGGLPAITLPPTSPPLIVMLHEAQHGSLPPYALGAVNDLRAAGRDARPVDDDLVNGEGQIPTWLKPALAPGRVIMGGNEDGQQLDDALVLLDGERVVKAVKLPASKDAILEACK